MRCGSKYVLACALLGWAATGVFAEELKVYPDTGPQFFLGLDDTSPPTQSQDGRAQDIQNVMLGIGRDIRQRYGIKVIGAQIDRGGVGFPDTQGLYYTKFSSGTERIFAMEDGVGYYLDGASWAQVTGQTVTLSNAANDQFVFTTALDEIIGTNNVDIPIRYDGTTVNRITLTGLTGANDLQKAKTVVFFRNYLIFGNTTESGTARPTRIRWANIGTTTTWTNADRIDIGALGGQEINCLAELYDTVFVGLTDSIYRMSFVGGSDTFNFAKVSDDIGCIAKNSVQSVILSNGQTGLVFLDKDKKVYFYNGVSVQDIGQLIKTTLNTLRGSRLQYAVSADSNTDYLLCATKGDSQTSNNLCLDFQYQIGEWTKHTNLNANAMAHVLDTASKEQVYFGTLDGFVYQFDDQTPLVDDVGSASGTIEVVNDYVTSTTSGLTVLYDNGRTFTTGAFVGAPIKIVGGTGAGQTSFLSDNTATGLIVASAFTTRPDATSSYEVGAIDSFYTTKWYDYGTPAKLKHFLELYFWANADVASTTSVGFAFDFQSDTATRSASLAASTNSVWGTGLWGTAVWGAGDTIFVKVLLEGEGRYVRYKFSEDDPGESFRIYGFVPIFREGDIF